MNTQLGRVVYDRLPHTFKFKDIRRIVLSHTKDREPSFAADYFADLIVEVLAKNYLSGATRATIAGDIIEKLRTEYEIFDIIDKDDLIERLFPHGWGEIIDLPAGETPLSLLTKVEEKRKERRAGRN